MNRRVKLVMVPGLIVALGFVAPSRAMAGSFNIDLDTIRGNSDVEWKVSEVTNEQMVVGSPIYGLVTFGGVRGLTIPFTDNDGYWTAHVTFRLPANARSPVLTLQSVGVDDRAVVLLNGTIVTDVGTRSAGNGYMTYIDGGPNRPRTFSYASGPQGLSIQSGFVSGVNTLEARINNTNEGVLGVPVPVTSSSPSSFGLTGTVAYSTPGH